MNKLECKDFKDSNVNLFINYHNWKNTMPEQYKEMLYELSDQGCIFNKDKQVLNVLQNKLDYGGYKSEIK